MAKKILLVEDDVDARKVLKDHLSRHFKYIVEDVGDVKACLERLESAPDDYQVVLTDWVMSPMSGADLLDAIKEKGVKVAVIVFTGRDEAGIAAYSKGARNYFRKPVDPDIIGRYIEGLIEQDRFLGEFASKIKVVSEAKQCLIWSYEQKAGEKFILSAVSGEKDFADMKGATLEMSDALRRVLDKSESHTVRNFQETPRFHTEEFAKYCGWQTMLGISLKYGSDILGWVELFYDDENVLDGKQKTYLGAWTQSAAESLANTKLASQSQELLNLSKLLDENTDIGKISEAIVHKLAGLINADAACLYLRNFTEEKFNLVGHIGKSGPPPQYLPNDSLAEFSGGQKLHIYPSERQQFFPGLEPDDFQSQIALAVSRNTTVLGILVLGCQVPNAFSESNQRLLRAGGELLTSLLDQVKLREYLNEINLLSRQSELGEQELLKRAADRLLSLSGADNVVIYPYDPVRRIFFDVDKMARVGEYVSKKKTPKKEKPREKGLAQIVRHVEQLIATDLEGPFERIDVNEKLLEKIQSVDDDGILNKEKITGFIKGEGFIQDEKIRSFIGLSLRTQTSQDKSLPVKEVGILYVNFRSGKQFMKSELLVLQIFARQLAALVAERRAQKLETDFTQALQAVLQAIGSADDPLPVILQKAAELFGADYGSISRIVENGKELEYLAIFQTPKLSSRPKKAPQSYLTRSNDIPLGKRKQSTRQGITGSVAREGQEVYAPDVMDRKEIYLSWYADTRSEYAVPIKNALGIPVAVLNFESRIRDAFPQDIQERIVRFTKAVAAAIQHHDLFNVMDDIYRMASTNTLESALDAILTGINKILGANIVSSINLYDQTNKNFYAIKGKGPDQAFVDEYLLLAPRTKGIDGSEGIGRYVLRNEQPLYFEDISSREPSNRKELKDKDTPEPRREAYERGIKSIAAVPLLYNNQVVGVLFIQSVEKQIQFPDFAKRLLETYARQTAVVVYNAQHYVTSDLYNKIYQSLIDEDRQKVLDNVVTTAMKTVVGEYSELWIHEARSGDLVRKAIHKAPGIDVNETVDRIRLGEKTINRRVFEDKEHRHLIIPDVAQEELKGTYKRIYMDAKSEVTVPILYQGECIGTLNAESKRDHAYSEHDAVRLRLFADLAAIAIQISQYIRETSDKAEELKKAYEVLEKINKELEKAEELKKAYEDLEKANQDISDVNYRLERRTQSLAALTEIGQLLTTDITRDELDILRVIHKEASLIMDTNNMYIALYDEKRAWISFKLAFIDGKPLEIPDRPLGQGRTEWIIRHQKPILTYTKKDATSWYQQPDTQEYIGQTFASWIGVPMMLGERVVGVVATYHKTEEFKYDPDHQKILTLMARQAAIALENARLARELNRRIQELNELRQLSDDLTGSLIE